MRTFYDLLLEEIKNKNIENIQEVRKSIHKKWVQDKIEKYLIKHPFLFKEQLEKEILNNIVVASFFAKDPIKQNLSEKLAEKILRKNEKIKDLIFFSHNKKIYIEDGKIIEKSNKTKALDFKFSYNNEIFYGTQKFTNSNGGAQDNQFLELKNTLKQVKDFNNFVCLIDGPYFNENKINELKKIAPNSIICSCLELGEELEKRNR